MFPNISTADWLGSKCWSQASENILSGSVSLSASPEHPVKSKEAEPLLNIVTQKLASESQPDLT